MDKYFNPVQIVKTDDWRSELTANINILNITNPIIVTSEGNRKRLHLDSMFLHKNIFSEVDNNPTFVNCEKALTFCNNRNFDGVIAIGGGSAMDLAKVVMSHLCLEKENIYELINFTEPYPRKIPSIFLPTTHGTGSEVTMWGSIWDMVGKKKYSISHIGLYPNVAILDGNLTITLPLGISITTVMDALSHSFESIWNKNANPTSTNYAISAICSIIKNVLKLKEDPHNPNIRNNLLSASTSAGLAFSNTKTAAAHSISYPLTIQYGIPHGVASSISLIPMLDIMRNSIMETLNQICKNNKITFDELKESIRSIPQGVIPYKLSLWGVHEDDIPNLVKTSFTKGRMDNTIIDLNESDIFSILKNIY